VSKRARGKGRGIEKNHRGGQERYYKFRHDLKGDPYAKSGKERLIAQRRKKVGPGNSHGTLVGGGPLLHLT